MGAVWWNKRAYAVRQRETARAPTCTGSPLSGLVLPRQRSTHLRARFGTSGTVLGAQYVFLIGITGGRNREEVHALWDEWQGGDAARVATGLRACERAAPSSFAALHSAGIHLPHIGSPYNIL
jgi:hypothetical protein